MPPSISRGARLRRLGVTSAGFGNACTLERCAMIRVDIARPASGFTWFAIERRTRRRAQCARRGCVGTRSVSPVDRQERAREESACAASRPSDERARASPDESRNERDFERSRCTDARLVLRCRNRARQRCAQEPLSNAFPRELSRQPSTAVHQHALRGALDKAQRVFAITTFVRYECTRGFCLRLYGHAHSFARRNPSVQRLTAARFATYSNRQCPCRFFRTLNALAGTCNLESDTDARHWPIAP